MAGGKPSFYQNIPGQLLKRQVYSRSYYSYHHPRADKYTPTQHKILSSALSNVPNHGFVKQSLVQGCRDAGYGDTTHAVFQGGVFDLIKYHLYVQRHKLALLKPAIDEQEGKNVEKRIRRYCVERLKGNQDLISKWPEALAVMGLPSNVPESVLELGKLADEIWFLVDDKDSDITWYTKRATLSAIYSSTELFMTQDKSPNFEKTFEFLDRRLTELSSLQSSASSFSNWLQFSAISGVNLVKSQLARG
ncbi:ubiquinone biosynthesis protein COQ9 [Lipomyces japonicus]|uniref:ubiquinone biosynthesis protein COQ9 n=1 Tax=Lipomyces japonicus TaxID=56871 RepID=UPI0034CD6E2D